MKRNLILFAAILTCFAAAVFSQNEPDNSQNSFIRMNSDLSRIGYSDFKNLVVATVKTEIYRMDDDFKLGVGDSVVINLSGKLQETDKAMIDKDGKIVIPSIGEIYLLGLNIKESKNLIQKEINKKYANVEVSFNIVGVQPIRVTVLGQVEKPGVYVLSPFSKIVEALSNAGGPNSKGSLINIKLIRKGKEVITLDICSYLFEAKESKNILLKDEDVVFVGPYTDLIAVRGDVVMPGIYEFYDNEKISNIIKRAGGLCKRNTTRKISLFRSNDSMGTEPKSKEILVKDIKELGAADELDLRNEDSIIVTTESNRLSYTENKYRIARVIGEIQNPGEYLLEKNEKLSSVIKRAGGLKPEAFVEGTIFMRQSQAKKEDKVVKNHIEMIQNDILKNHDKITNSLLSDNEKRRIEKAINEQSKALDILKMKQPTGRIVISLENIINGKEDMVLENDDSIIIPNNPECVNIVGEVFNQNAIRYSSNNDVKYYLDSAGGITPFGDEKNIFIIKANGMSESVKNGNVTVSSGDSIIVPKKYELNSENLNK
ncbi:MAG: SLBB domain-containing protein [Elusimicrobia bacterium]|nr:SLBB domain-containing protein [Candidatus Liberimonas magnetica]